MNARIRVLLVDDHPVVRRGIRACLAPCEHIEVVGEAADGMEGLIAAREQKPDIVLTDLDMPQMNGFVFVEALRRELPQTRVLILSMHARPEDLLRIIQCGAKGYVLKEADPRDLIQGIDAVARGDVFFSPEIARVALQQLSSGAPPVPKPLELTRRERDVLIGIAEGLSSREIAERLGVGVRTIETHRENLMNKLHIHSVAGLTRFAVAKGLVSLSAGF